MPNERRKVTLDGKFPIVADFATKKLHAVCRMLVKADYALLSSITLQYVRTYDTCKF